MAEYPDWKPLKDIYEASNGKCRLWIINPVIFKDAGLQLDWGTDVGRFVVRQIYQEICIHRTMSTRQELPDGSTHYPGIHMAPITIVVEETHHDDLGLDDVNIRVESAGRAHVRNLFSSQVESNLSENEGYEQTPGFNFDEHVKGVLTAFDWHNERILNRDTPYIYATVEELKLVMKASEDPSLVETTSHLVGAKRLHDMIYRDPHGGMDFVFNQINEDLSNRPPNDRPAYMWWLCFRSPIMTRALELAWKYAKEEKQQVLVYVDNPWIQYMTVGLFRITGFKTITVRPDDKPKEKAEIISGWNAPDSPDEIFVVNVNTMGAEVNVHRRCCKAIFLNWMFSIKTMLQVVGRFSRVDQTQEVMVHLIKLKNSYYDNIERISCTEWAAQLSAEIKLPGWMTDHLREICIFELIKTTLHQPFNRYAWVVNLDTQGIEMEYHSNDTVRLGHMISALAKFLLDGEQDKDFWVKNADILIEACRYKMESWETPEQVEEFLMQSPENWKGAFFKYFETAVQVVRQSMKTDRMMKARIEAVKRGVERRAGGQPLSEEFVFASDANDGSAGSSKRKADGNGQANSAKRQAA
ncbi:hypothetical protein FPOA_06821 [Fusarium poae]|uniref:Helicase C-terminal domain-containing protein n=1 Tax=Fusarium poae TaxID=36050 RepID=A0A1B8AIR9_FUSPO|nr:hypothetical protein FPOA_06821 [Fusarium poae]